MTKQDWRELGAGFDLDRFIAEQLGDTEIEERFGWWEDPITGATHRRFLTCKEHEIIPSFSTDVDAAIRLIGDRNDWRLAKVSNGFNASIYPTELDLTSHGFADTPALAICRAWLAQKEL